MENTVLYAVQDIKHTSKLIKEVQSFIQEETLAIIKWENSVHHLKNNIANVNDESFYRLALKRAVFTNSVRALRDVVQQFLDKTNITFAASFVSQ